MNAVIKVAARKVREWTIRRDDLIRAAVAAGASQRAVAVEAGLSHTAVQKIIARGSQDNLVGGGWFASGGARHVIDYPVIVKFSGHATESNW